MEITADLAEQIRKKEQELSRIQGMAAVVCEELKLLYLESRKVLRQ
jgi:hypothetical protein